MMILDQPINDTSLLYKIRNWLIRLLAGGDTIILNASMDFVKRKGSESLCLDHLSRALIEGNNFPKPTEDRVFCIREHGRIPVREFDMEWQPIAEGMVLCESDQSQFLYRKVTDRGIIFRLASVMPTDAGWRLDRCENERTTHP